MQLLTRIIKLICLISLTLLTVGNPMLQVYAQSKSTQLVAGISNFFDRGANGYLFWQFSGEKSSGLGSDRYSFYAGSQEADAVCSAFRELRGKYPDKFVGVNMWDLGRHDYVKIVDSIDWLAKCQGNMLRVNSGVYLGVKDIPGAKVQIENLLQALTTINNKYNLSGGKAIRLIIAIADHPNGGGGMPKSAGKNYYNGNYSEQLDFTNAIVSAGGSHEYIYAYEVANEPHCGGDVESMPGYLRWAETFAAILAQTGKYTSLGQMANFDVPNCDSVVSADFFPVSGFVQSNQLPQVTITSAHFYNGSQKFMAQLALEKAQQISKPFYVGEADLASTVAGVIPSSVVNENPNRYFIAKGVPTVAIPKQDEPPENNGYNSSGQLDAEKLDTSQGTDKISPPMELSEPSGISIPQQLNNYLLNYWITIVIVLIITALISTVLVFLYQKR